MEFKEFIAERKRMCKAHAPDGFICKCAELKCPLHELAQRSPEKSCYAGCTRYPKEAEKIVEQWTKENPPLKNINKLIEIVIETFGIDAVITWGEDANTVKITSSFDWNEPYKEPEK